MKDPITAEQALAGLRAAVAERGRDYVDQLAANGACRYVIDGGPSCIAATALFKVGVPVEELARWEGNSVRAMKADRRVDASGRMGFLTEDAVMVLTRAQQHQDVGRTWGEALDVSEGFFRLSEVKP